jgi:hypothetical protein
MRRLDVCGLEFSTKLANHPLRSWDDNVPRSSSNIVTSFKISRDSVASLRFPASRRPWCLIYTLARGSDDSADPY